MIDNQTSAEPLSADDKVRRRRRSIAIAVALMVMVALFYAATIIHMGGNALNRPM